MRLLKRMFLLAQIRALETTIDGQSKCLEVVREPYFINRIIIAQINARNELRKVRREYAELRKSGDRETWRMAL
jgi:hypothetical protein